MVNLQKVKMLLSGIMVAAVVFAKVAIGEMGEEPSAPPKHEPCPKGCMCFPRHRDKFSALEVQCGEQSLSSVPTITDNDISISILNLSYNDLNNLTLRGYQSTEDLYLQYCKLYTIDEKVFYGFKNLKFVDLSNNLLTSIPPNLFADNHLLETLILRNNDLRATDPNTPFLKGPASLKSLDLQSCKLSTLSSVTFSSLRNLRNLDISRNQLIVLDSEFLHSLHKLESITLGSNPWKCGNKFQDMLCWIQRKLVAFRRETLECQDDNESWKIWVSDKQISFCCDSCKTRTLPQGYMPDVTETTPENPRVSCPQEIVNYWTWLPFLIGMCVGMIFLVCISVFVVCVCDRIFTKTRSSSRDSELHFVETHIASEDSEEREEESRNTRRRRRRRPL